jgi:prepilin-type N-terminal cleavage/methylation domain-containing protein
MGALAGENMHKKKCLNKNNAGFTLLEALISMVILSGGLLALASAFSQGLVIVSTSHFHQIAKERASEAVESVFTSRDTRIINWNAVRNVSNGGVFLDSPQPIREAGPDGLANTADDGTEAVERLPGLDNLLDTEDDVVITLNNFSREIVITDIGTNLRLIRVIINYRIGNLNRQHELITYISSFA